MSNNLAAFILKAWHMQDLTQPGVAKLLADQIKTAIDNNSAADGPPKFSWRVAPSSLGDECVARLWLKFRWTAKAQKPGRINRIFKRGNGREDYFTALLRRDGWEVRDYAQRLVMRSGDGKYFAQDWEDDIAPGYEDVHQDPWHIAECRQQDKWLLKQWRLVRFNGHMSGYSDGRARHPIYTNGEWIGVEYKTYNTKRFTTLVNGKGGVKTSDYEYYVQVVTYLKEFDLPWCLFLAENKNDDDIYPEIILRDDATAEQRLTTAHTVITSPTMPARFAQSPAHHVCKYCDWVGVCHNGVPVEINCRSCRNCEATEGGKFKCNKWQAVIPDEEAILAACPHHTPVV
jgi:hypothetical protein